MFTRVTSLHVCDSYRWPDPPGSHSINHGLTPPRLICPHFIFHITPHYSHYKQHRTAHADCQAYFMNISFASIQTFDDHIKLKNILFIHDYLNKALPSCFQNDLTKLDDIYTLIRTRNACSGYIHVPKHNSTTYGIFSIVHRSISDWNEFTKLFKTNLAHTSRIDLKTRLEEYLLQQY